VDPVKIAIFLAVFGLLLVIGRMLARMGETRIDSSLPPDPEGPPLSPAGGSASRSRPETEGRRSPAITGAEFGMPLQLPAVRRLENGNFNRPLFTNYHFSKIDLVEGPADPNCFCDDFTLEMENPATGLRWKYTYTVATPSGFTQLMSSEKFESLFFDAPVVIVSRWDLLLILQTVIDEIMRDHGTDEAPAEIIAPRDRIREQ
jgi:hypothetical protein